jgi:anti-sigma-K factor RskA
MNDMDGVGLERLATADVPPGLASINDRVMSRIASERPGQDSGASPWRVAVTGVALFAGIAAGAMPSHYARAAPQPMSLMDAGGALAPSALLLGGQ